MTNLTMYAHAYALLYDFLKGSIIICNRNSGRKENNFCHSIKSPFSHSFFVMLSFDKGNPFIY